jgi:hypothetical protein
VNRIQIAVLGVMSLGLVACQEMVPTSVDENLLPDEPHTVEVRLGWDEFASNLQVFGGFGSAADLGSGVVARSFEDTLDARTLTRFSAFPATVTVRDTTGSTKSDSDPIFRTGRVAVVLDTLASTNEEPVELALGALHQEWHPRTATWTAAVDTINDHRAWDEDGAGPVTELGTTTWDPAQGDTVFFPIDSTTLAALRDTTDLSRGVRLDILTPGHRVRIRTMLLRLDVESSLNPDTTVLSTVVRSGFTFIYSPVPEPPPDGIRIGGTPSWRTALQVTPPARLTGPADLCQSVGCPLELTAEELNYAALVLHTRQSEPAFQPTDSVSLDVRPVLSPAALPKSPLGSSLTGALGRRVAAELFGAGEGAAIEVPVTKFIQDQLRGETDSGTPPATTLALLSTFEPLSIAYASFHGPGSELEPELKLILTTGAKVDLP